MVLFDVNILIYSINPQTKDYADYRRWIENTTGGDAPFGVAELVLSSFLRIVTNPKAFANPPTLEAALDVVEDIRNKPNCHIVRPGPRHWEVVLNLCRQVNARGNLVPDAYLAALAIESDCQWITTDRDYARFPGLRWRHPLDY